MSFFATRGRHKSTPTPFPFYCFHLEEKPSSPRATPPVLFGISVHTLFSILLGSRAEVRRTRTSLFMT